jgi:hypothetical protein
MGWVRRRLSYANIVASIALFLALGGGAYALVGNRFVGRNGVVEMCVQSSNHVPVVVSPGSACPTGSTLLTLNQRGERGLRGARGPKGKPGLSALPASFMDAYMARDTTVCSGCQFVFQRSDQTPGVEVTSTDIHLGPDDATFTVDNTGLYEVTVAVGPAGPVQLEVNGTSVGPNEASCSGSSACAFQRIVSVTQVQSRITLVNTTGTDEHEDTGSGITIVRVV